MWDDDYDYFDGLDYDEPDYAFGGDLDYSEPDYTLDDLDYEQLDYAFADDLEYSEPAVFSDLLDSTEASRIKSSSSSSKGPGKTPKDNTRKTMQSTSKTDTNKKSSKSTRESKRVSSSRFSSKSMAKKTTKEPQLKRTGKPVPEKNNPKNTRNLPMKDHHQTMNQSSSKHRKHPKRDLAGAIRKFSASKVKISKESTKWARKMADTHIEYVRKFCQKNEKSKGIFNHFEFTGSFYEHLKTEDANELDILVALDTKNNAELEVEEVKGVPGYALIKVTKKSSKYWRFANNDGYVRPTKVRSWFFGVVQQAVNQYKKQKGEKDPVLKPSDNGPAAKLRIEDKEAKKKLEVDLVPAFLFKPKKGSSHSPPEGRHYVAKQLPQEMIVPGMKCTREMLWRQSFSLQEKKKMENLDKSDSGCRREVVKVTKTIVKNDSTLAQLSSYHVKTAFLHYNFDEGQENLEWSVKDIGDRLKGLLEYLRKSMSEKNLSHFFIKDLNLLNTLSDPSLENIEGRLKKLITNESELRRVLAVQPVDLAAEANGKPEAKKKSKPKKKRQGTAKPKVSKPVSFKTKGSFKTKAAKLKTTRKPTLEEDEELLYLFDL